MDTFRTEVNACGMGPSMQEEAQAEAQAGPQAGAVAVPVPDSLPREKTEHYRPLARGQDIESLDVTRGQYRMQYRIPYDGEPVRKRDLTLRLDTGDEYKRVHFYKIDVHPQEDPDPVTGETVATVTAVFHVLDNVLPLVPIAWAGLAATVGGAGWLLMDKAEEVTSRGVLGLVPIIAAGATLFLLFRS